MTLGMDRAFGTMTATAEEWDAPLFLGEFGVAAEATNAGDYVAAIYDRMDACLASGAQWNYSPRWNERDKDGWNGEDFSILDSPARFVPTSVPVPIPGTRPACRSRSGSMTASPQAAIPCWCSPGSIGPSWVPRRSSCPASIFPPDSSIEVSERGLACERDQARQLLLCRGSRRSDRLRSHECLSEPRAFGRFRAQDPSRCGYNESTISVDRSSRRLHNMHSPFPGMDPYLETQGLLADFHTAFLID